MQSALRHTPDIRPRNGDRDDLVVAIQDLAIDVSADPEALKHTSGVVIGAPTDIGDDSELWFGAERASAGLEGGPGIKTAVVVDDDLYFASPLRKARWSRCHHREPLNLERSDPPDKALSAERPFGIDDESDNCGSHAVNLYTPNVGSKYLVGDVAAGIVWNSNAEVGSSKYLVSLPSSVGGESERQ